jgi:hypothetical protein
MCPPPVGRGLSELAANLEEEGRAAFLCAAAPGAVDGGLTYVHPPSIRPGKEAILLRRD